MAKDPGFVFYPGDYLRDTQCLSENVQVAYDRIMCEHMRNICISQQQLNFFTKKLNSEEREEILTVLTKVSDGYQIDWVVESITKRRAYSESRANNRSGKRKNANETYVKDPKTYVQHMDNEIEIENEDKERIGVTGEKGEIPLTGKSEKVFIVPEMLSVFRDKKPGYIFQREKDFPALLKIAEAIAEQEHVDLLSPEGFAAVKTSWTAIAEFIPTHRLYKDFTLFQIEKYFQGIVSSLKNYLHGPPDQHGMGKRTTIENNLDAAAAARELLKRRQEV